MAEREEGSVGNQLEKARSVSTANQGAVLRITHQLREFSVESISAFNPPPDLREGKTSKNSILDQR